MDYATYEEKTCCLTSDEGFEFSAPMVAVVVPGISRAMMLFLQEVGADGLADESTLGNIPANDPRARQGNTRSLPSCLCLWVALPLLDNSQPIARIQLE